VLEQTTVHLLVNERDEVADCRFVVTSEEPLRIERWDPRTGRRTMLADHEEVTEATEFDLPLAPRASVFVVATVPELLPEPEEETPELSGSVNLGIAEPPRPVSGWEIRDGAIVPQRELPLPPDGASALEEGRWDLVPGCKSFSGTMAYRLVLPVTADWLDRPVILELPEVRYVAELLIGDRSVGRSLWSPHEFDLTGLLHEGDNELVLRVTNTLANQALREEVIAQARSRGWWNVYCERARPMMRESLPSGLNPAVRIWLGE
jgi:hypothetical protein